MALNEISGFSGSNGAVSWTVPAAGSDCRDQKEQRLMHLLLGLRRVLLSLHPAKQEQSYYAVKSGRNNNLVTMKICLPLFPIQFFSFL